MSRIDFGTTPFVEGAVGANSNRLYWRAVLLLEQQQRRLCGARVLDMAAADSRFSYAALHYGASHVTSVEGREDQVALGRQRLQACGVREDQYDLVSGDVVDYLFKCRECQFDVVLCFGFFYHTLRQVEILQEIRRLRPQLLILDTTVASERWYRRPGRFVKRFRTTHVLPANALKLWRSIEGDEVMFFATEDAAHPSATIHANLAGKYARESVGGRFRPTAPMVERLFEMHGYVYEKIDWHNAGIDDWTALEDYRRRTRVSYLASVA